MDRLLKVNEVSEWFSISSDRVYSMVREGDLPHVRLHRSIRFKREDLQQFLDEGGKGLPGGVWKRED